MIAAVLKLPGTQRNVEGMQNEFGYPKSEEVIEISETLSIYLPGSVANKK